MKQLILLSFIVCQFLIAGSPGEEVDRLIFPDGRDRHGKIMLGSETSYEKYKDAYWERNDKKRRAKLDQWFKLFPMLTADEPTDAQCRTIIRSYHAAEDDMRKNKPRGPDDLQIENWHERCCQNYVNALSRIIQAACHFYPPAIDRLHTLFLSGIGLQTPYAIDVNIERLRFYKDLRSHAKEQACCDPCLACRWGAMYESILEEAERKYQERERLLAALESPKPETEHGADEGVAFASASSDEEHEGDGIAPITPAVDSMHQPLLPGDGLRQRGKSK
ncbi:MAG: hypothetical protein CMM87_01670 [Rickettsiales bacterium]|nr:hypothetical protein [Rickettsiales bacterium]|tara:strand:+ start:1847 stop:2677 length:831 start_codon:yes stop_codon:yes gene_type:complete